MSLFKHDGCYVEVRLLLESEGSVENAHQTTEAWLAHNKKMNLVMDRYGVKIAALQEAKWFDCDCDVEEGVLVGQCPRKVTQR